MTPAALPPSTPDALVDLCVRARCWSLNSKAGGCHRNACREKRECTPAIISHAELYGMRAALSAAAEHFAMVPRTPTAEMCEAAAHWHLNTHLWRAAVNGANKVGDLLAALRKEGT